MAYKCNAICDEGKIRDFIAAKDPILGEKFDRFLLESYIEDNKRVKWCPIVPHCGNAIRIEGDNEYCEELWMSKCKDDSKTVIWMSENAKHCPKCHTPVQKNGGCNLVRCRCRQLFCYVQGLKKPIDDKKDLLCYTQYYERYSAHDFGSLKAAANYMKRKLQVKLLKLEARELQSKDFSWAANGLNRLLQSRRTLSCSYPVAFYVFGKAMFVNEMKPKEMEIKQNIFENLQQQLEENVKRLSMLLEEPFANYPEDKLLETRMKIITLSTVIDNLCIKLYDCIDNDLLVPLQEATHTIARYRSEGVDKASELPS